MSRWRLLGLIGLILLLVSCGSNGESGRIASSPASTALLERQVIDNLLSLYRTAIIQEDIDRLQEILQPGGNTAQIQASGVQDADTFRATMSEAFLAQTFINLELPETDILLAPDRRSVTFLEVESVVEPDTLAQHTRVFRTTWQLAQDDVDGVQTVRIATITRVGPVFQVTTHGQLIAAAPARIAVTTASPSITAIDIVVPETGQTETLLADGNHFRGIFTPPNQNPPQPLQVRVQDDRGAVTQFAHPYRLRRPGEGVVHPLTDFDTERFVATTLAPDGTIWFGGEEITPLGTLGTLVQVAADGQTILNTLQPTVASLPAGATSRIEDLVFDTRGRLHALFVAQVENGAVVGNGVVVRSPAQPELFCQTVNVFDPAYPFRVRDLTTDTLQPSPSTRLQAATDGDVWLFGSDGGVAQVVDTFQDEQCPDNGVPVQYEPIFRRDNSDLLANTVPAFIVARNAALWFGTALGITRLQAQQFTPVPFSQALSLQGDVATLEMFFRAVAEAIFNARPLTTVAIGAVSFVELFGSPLVKEDLVFSVVEDDQGDIWIGTLGGGIRRIDPRSPTPQETLHLTRADGLASNNILALATGPDATIWAATDEGVSRLRPAGASVAITTFTTLDGLSVPVRDLVVDDAGTAWLATDAGIFRLTPQGGELQGVVQDTAARPVAGADVLGLGTPFRTVTDAAGRFTLANLPLGPLRVQINGQTATAGPFTTVAQDVNVTADTQVLNTIVLAPRAPGVVFDPAQGGTVPFPDTPAAALDIPAQTTQLPAGIAPIIHLTSLPLNTFLVPLPESFTAVAAADLQPIDITFTMPVSLTLPNQSALPAGQFVTLLLLNDTTLTYEAVGVGRVSDDGAILTTLSGGLTRLSTAVFARSSSVPSVGLFILVGDGQTGIVGTSLVAPLTVLVVDAAGNPLPGLPVTFTVTTGDGSLNTSRVMTSATGEAATTLTLGSTPGLIQIEAQVDTLEPVVFTATGTPDPITPSGPPASLLLLAGDGQTGIVGTSLATPLAVVVVDAIGNPLPGLPVTFAILFGTGSLSPAQVTTNATGEAATTLTLGSTPGLIQIEAQVDTLEPVVFTATGTPDPITPSGPPASLLLLAGDGQTGIVGTSLAAPLAVVVVDAAGNPLSGLSVTFTVTTGNGRLNTSFVTTNAEGEASALLTLGTTAGINRVEARVDTGGPVAFIATGESDQTMARLLRVSGNNQSGPPGATLPAPLVVRLEDQFRNGVSGQTIMARIVRGAEVLENALTVVGQTRETMTVAQNEAECSPILLGLMGNTLLPLTTDAQGEACFRLLLPADSEVDIVVEVVASDLPDVEPVTFLEIVGEVDTPDIPLDLLVNATGDTLFVADRRSGLQVIDVSDPEMPQQRRTLDLDGIEVRLDLAGDRLYVGTNFPLRLYILDDQAQEVLGRVQFPEAIRRHGITGIAVRRGVTEHNGAAPRDFAYMVTDARIANTGTLQVFDVTDPLGCLDAPTRPENTNLPGRPRGLALSGDLAYVPAGEAGLLIFDIGDPGNRAPTLAATVEGTFFSDITLADGVAYVIETRQGETIFTVLDLRDPLAPQRLGTLPVRMATQVAEVPATIATDANFAYLVQFASGLEAIDIRTPAAPVIAGAVDTPSQALNVTIAGDFLYISDQIFGVQVVRRPMEAELAPMIPLDPPLFNPVPAGTTRIVVDANATRAGGNGTETAPYRALTDALQAIRQARQAGQVPVDEMLTVLVQPGTYTPLTTQEIFPLDLRGVAPLTIQSTAPDEPDMQRMTVIDAGLTGDIFFLDTDPLASAAEVIIAGLTLTHGAHGVFTRGAAAVTLRHNRIIENIFAGISMGSNGAAGHTITQNVFEDNGQEGIVIFQTAMTTSIEENDISGNGDIGVSISIDTVAAITHNTIMGNGDDGVRVDDGSTASVRGNDIRMNGSLGGFSGTCTLVGSGLTVSTNSRADITDNNTIEGNRRNGIIVQNDATITLTDNTIIANRLSGVFIEEAPALFPMIITGNNIRENGFQGFTGGLVIENTAAVVTIAQNIIEQNNGNGLTLEALPMVTMVDNILRSNSFNGLVIINSNASIEGGTIGQNIDNGVVVFLTSSVDIGLAGEDVQIVGNGGIGIFAINPAVVEIDSSRIVFEANAGGDIVGPVSDRAPE